MDIAKEIQPFTTDQLRQLDGFAAIDTPELFQWSDHQPLIRGPEPDNGRIRDFAALYAIGKLKLGMSRIESFAEVYRPGRLHDMSVAHSGYTPLELAGNAAGQLQVANILTTWYNLQLEDVERVSPLSVEANLSLVGLQGAVCYAPKQLGITSESVAYHFIKAKMQAQNIVEAATNPVAELTTFLVSD